MARLQRLILAVLGLSASGCAGSAVGVRPDIHSQVALERALAIRHAADDGDRQAIPLIVDRLEDEDEAVRMYAILALERMTGTRRGYDYTRDPLHQQEAVERWRAFVRGEAGEKSKEDNGKAAASQGGNAWKDP